MTTGSAAPVGNDAARAVHGRSAGADVALLGDPGRVCRQGSGPGSGQGSGQGSSPGELLLALGATGSTVVLSGDAAAVLGGLADLAGSDLTRPLVVAAADLRTSPAAVLDLLDKPGITTAVATVPPGSVQHGLDLLTPVRVGADRRLVESVGSAAHVVTGPDHALPGVLRVDAADRDRAARLWRAGADVAAGLPPADQFSLAVLALVRGGLPVQSVPLGPYSWSRTGVAAAGAPGGPWQQRLRGASRGDDGFLSTYAVRRLSRRLTRVGLAHGWSPNVVTGVSLALGLVAAGLVITDNRWAWVGAAVLVQLALVVDCVDGEIARFTRRFSAFGAWLDAVGDRVKEYAVLAALAVVAARRGDAAWLLATVTMALVTVRHLEDYAYTHRISGRRRSRPDLLPLDRARDLGPPQGRTTWAEPRSRRWRVTYWAKKVMHLPIAERYLLISLGLLTFSPRLLLWVLLVAVAVALLWTQGGRTAMVLLGRDRVRPSGPDPAHPADSAHETEVGEHLWHQLDAGPLGLLAARPLARVLRHPLAWQLPAVLWLAEVAVVAAVAGARLGEAQRGTAFAFLAAVAYHRYDTVYRLRDTSRAPEPWVGLLGLGAPGRVLAVLACGSWAPQWLDRLLWVGAAYLAVVYLSESAAGWRRWSRGRPLVGDTAPQEARA